MKQKYVYIGLGVFVLLISYVYFKGFASGDNSWYYGANIAITFFLLIYYFLKANKKKVYINQDTLIISRFGKILREVNLKSIKRVVPGTKSIKLQVNDQVEILNYSDYDKDSIKTIKSLA